MRAHLRSLIAVSLLLLPSLAAVSPADAAHQPMTVRIGIVAYQNFYKLHDNYEQLFTALSKRPEARDVTFKFAVGTYSEVLDWYNNELIDVAILTPGPAAELLSSPD